jgi:hypothetical protein
MAEAQANTRIAGHASATEQKPGPLQLSGLDLGRARASRGPAMPEERAYAILLTQNVENRQHTTNFACRRGSWESAGCVFLCLNRGLRIVDGTAVSLATRGFLSIVETTLQVAHLSLQFRQLALFFFFPQVPDRLVVRIGENRVQ